MNCIGVTAVVLGMLGLVIVIALVGHYMEKKRTEALARVAEELAFEFLPRGDAGLSQRLARFELFNLGHSREMTNLMRGSTRDLEISIFDYKYVTGSGKHQRHWNYSIFVACRPGWDFPQFSVAVENLFHKIGSVFGVQDIDFESHPAFSSRYLLRGPDENAIRQLFQPPVLEWFEQHPGLTVEGLADVIVLAKRPRYAPNKIRDLMSEGFDMIKTLDAVQAA